MKNLAALYKKYNLTKDDYYQHKHYTIITRQGIDKIQACEKINIEYDVIKCEKDFAVIKANANVGDYKVQTFGSALYGEKVLVKTEWNGKETTKWKDTGTTQTYYVMEMAEKRAMSRAVLKLTGFYELGVFSEDESEDFKKEKQAQPTPQPKEIPKIEATPQHAPENDKRTAVTTKEELKVVIDWAIKKKATIKVVETYYKLDAVQKAEVLKAIK